jgi:hypothetical protein
MLALYSENSLLLFHEMVEQSESTFKPPVL